jgi:hypothetical protein
MPAVLLFLLACRPDATVQDYRPDEGIFRASGWVATDGGLLFREGELQLDLDLRW